MTPDGRIVSHPARGLLMGNRGCLHDAGGRIVTEVRPTRTWIACLTAFRGRRRPLMSPGRYTELFFLDEAVALAAGHRPCAECRRDDFDGFRAAMATASGAAPPRAPAVDRILDAARIDRRTGTRVTFVIDAADVPDGAVVRLAGHPAPLLRAAGVFRAYDPSGWGPAPFGPVGGPVTVVTPRPAVDALRAGYRPLLHPSAGSRR